METKIDCIIRLFKTCYELQHNLDLKWYSTKSWACPNDMNKEEDAEHCVSA